jgi:hypothetical protein
MGTELAIIEPLRLPDPRRPAQMPSLPAWAISRLACVKDNWQNGKMELTLPTAMIPTSAQRDMITQHIGALSKFVERTPANSADCEAETLVIVTKMLLALPAPRSTETGNEAKGEAYLAALDDISPWAVQEAIRKWYRGEHGAKYDYHWSPVPADLRSLARSEEYRVRGRMTVLGRICNAVPLVEYSDEHRKMMLKKLVDLGQNLKPMQTRDAAE